jgi:predicted RND superfamily exporter protein
MTTNGNGTITATDRLALAITDFAIRRPWRTIVATLVLVVMAGSGLLNIGLATNYRVFFSPENPELVDNFLFAIKPESETVFSPRIADVVEKLTERAWKIPYAIRVDSVTNFQHSWAQGDDLTVEDLIRNGASMSQAELERKQAIAVAEPLLYGNLVARDVGATGVNVVLQYPEQSEKEVPAAVAVARQIAADIEAEFPGVEVAISGVSMLNNAFAEAGITDATSLIPAMYGILLIAMVLVLRSVSGTVATLMVVMFSTLVAVGIAGHFGVMLAPISVMAPIVIMTLAVADSVHILVSMLTLMREGRSKIEALRESLRINFLAVSITSITTVIGFLSLNFSDAPPFWHLGNITAMGIAAAWLFSVTTLPAVLSRLPIKVKQVPSGGTKSQQAMTGFARFVTSKYKPILIGGVVLAAGLVAMLPRIELNDQWIQYFDHRVVEGDGAEGINDPVYLQNLETFTAWLRMQPEVLHVYSYADIIKRLNKNMHGDDPSWYRIPSNRELAAQYLFLYELSLPFGLDLNDRISIDKSATRVTATLRDLPTAETRAFLETSQAWLRDNTPQYMWAKPTSATVMFSFISQRNIESMFTGNVLAVVLIAIVLMLSLRSFSLGGLSLIPNVLPILMTFGLWAILVGRVGMAAATVSATSLGIIVDNTVHFLTKYLRARREHGYGRPEAIEYAFRTVGMAIIANAMILTVGFAFLAFSTFRINVEMGLLTALAIAVALVVDFLLLPALLMVGHKRNVNTKGDISYEDERIIQQAA